MSRLTLAVLLIMPLSLASLQVGAQMVPVPETDPLHATLPDVSTKLYSTSSTSDPVTVDAVADTTASTPTAVDSALNISPSSTSETSADASTSVLPSALPASTSANPDALASAAPASPVASPGAPVTLPPKPVKVHDLPSPTGDHPRVRPFRAAAFGLTASTLGAGAELAIPIARTLNFRVGGNYVLVHYPFNVDGIDYSPGLKFTSGRATVDWFPHHGAFHVSAGALYFRNNISGTADVVDGQTFSLGGTNYINSVDDPIHGAASIAYGKQIAPLVLLGFGNILPRSGRHISVPFEFGGAYLKAPILNLKLSGTACTSQGCFNAATDPQVQANLTKEVNTLQSDLRFLQVYPVISLGLACRF